MAVTTNRFASTRVRLIATITIVCTAAGIGLGGVIEGRASIALLAFAGEAAKTNDMANPRPRDLPDFRSLAKILGPMVVNVSTVRIRKAADNVPGPFNDEGPFRDFWEKFFGGRIPGGPQRQDGLGSGFIIDRDGTILTNYHVVDGAEKIVIKLSDGETFDARVLGKDPKTDIAVVKIDAGRDLPAANLGDSDRLEVGEWVLAIGNPFGLDHTVTSGIVSAKGRNIGTGPYDSFIQTDASINPGNSGGPLINMRGEVVGINTAIFSQSGGNIGIGFAIPTNLVKDLLPQLKDKGKVVRGYLGAVVQRMTPDLAQALGLKSPRGALVSEAIEDGPAARAGIRAGDVIVEFNGQDVKDSADLPVKVARIAPGKTVRVKIFRDSKALTLPVTIGELQEREVIASADNGDLGLAVEAVTADVARTLGLQRAEGVVVTGVETGSAADEAGLRRGDVITQINRRPVRSLDDYNRAMAKLEKRTSLLLLVRRGKNSLFLALRR